MEQLVAVAVVRSGLGVLVGRRADGSPPWVFVGGKVEPSETPAAAAVREALEETGTTVRALGEIGRRVHPRTLRTVVYVDCEAANPLDAAVRSPAELLEVRWVDVDELDELSRTSSTSCGFTFGEDSTPLRSRTVTYDPDEQDEQDEQDEIVEYAMAVGGPAFVDELQYATMDAAEAACPWDGNGEEPPEYRRAWIAAARQLVAARQTQLSSRATPAETSTPDNSTPGSASNTGQDTATGR